MPEARTRPLYAADDDEDSSVTGGLRGGRQHRRHTGAGPRPEIVRRDHRRIRLDRHQPTRADDSLSDTEQVRDLVAQEDTRSLEGKTFSGLDKLAQWVEGLLTAQTELDKLGTVPLPAFSQTADTLLAAGRGMFASGTDFQALRQFVITSLENLPATQSYDAQILSELQRLGGSVNVQVGVEVVRVITEALNALPDAERARLVQSTTVLRTVEERLGQLLTDGEVDALTQGAVVRRDIDQSMQRDLSVAERAGLVQAADITRAIQQAMARDLSPAARPGAPATTATSPAPPCGHSNTSRGGRRPPTYRR